TALPKSTTCAGCRHLGSLCRPPARAQARPTAPAFQASPTASCRSTTASTGRSLTIRRRSRSARRRPRRRGGDGRLWHPEAMAAKAQSVLVVEDETSIASFVALYLKNAGYGIRTVGTGQEALDT